MFKSRIKLKINLNFYLHTSLWYFKRFYEGFKGLQKIFWGTANKCKNKNFKLIFSLFPGPGREGLSWCPRINTLLICGKWILKMSSVVAPYLLTSLSFASIFLYFNKGWNRLSFFRHFLDDSFKWQLKNDSVFKLKW